MVGSFRVLWVVVAAALGCSPAKRPSEPPSRAPLPDAPVTSQAAAPPTFEQRVVDRVLSESRVPAAVVVLELGQQARVAALGGQLGADPATRRHRPGSTVKPLVAWIAAERGVLDPGERVDCGGTLEPEGLRCFATHGPLDLERALTTSCNAYFYELGRRLGLGALASGLGDIGLARRTGLVRDEAEPFVATPEWARAQPQSPRWEMVVAAGHGPLEVTLLELAVAYAELSRRILAPHPRVSDAVRASIRDALRKVVEDEHATGHAAFVDGLEIAGKTGTAEAEPFGTEPREPAPENGWFVGFAPVEQPTTLVAAVVLGRGSGGKTAAPLVATVFRKLSAARREPR